MDNDCFLGHICLNNRCIFACHTNEDCSSSESCRNNTCINPCLVNPCGPNAVCTVGNHRAQCSCLDGMVASPTAKIGCIRSPAPHCAENRDCPEGWSCFEEYCRPICASDVNCLSNERCDRGSCKPICRRDDDCRNGELCQNLICTTGCRSDVNCPHHLSCVNQQCVDPCSVATACGTNAVCNVHNHVKTCECPAPLVGDARYGCKYSATPCEHNGDCPPNHNCFGNVCQSICHTDQNCLSDEKCVQGICRSICNSDSGCDQGLICENRICSPGCRNDLACRSTESCISGQCVNPCGVSGQCGQCAECSVINHGVQCSCPSGYLGNPLQSCKQPLQRCNSLCQCDESGVFCAQTCNIDTDCACAEICALGKCRSRCNPGTCPAGQLCQDGACVSGCRNNLDCSSDKSCINGQCLDPCSQKTACGTSALCKVSEHRVLCLCPDGYQGEPTQDCSPYECTKDNDCELDKRCDGGSCRNPCLQDGACGINAQCRVSNRQAQCSCPPGYNGNPLVDCVPETIGTVGACNNNPCGANTRCRNVQGGFECSCSPGCVGDPRNGCVCGDNRVNICAGQPCGRNAACRVINHNEPECYCPPENPHGDPYTECKPLYYYLSYKIHLFHKSCKLDTVFKCKYLCVPELFILFKYFLNINAGNLLRDVPDCRVTGCVTGECIRQGVEYVCKQGKCYQNFLWLTTLPLVGEKFIFIFNHRFYSNNSSLHLLRIFFFFIKQETNRSTFRKIYYSNT